MSDSNGQNEPSRLDRLEASHVRLMTDHEVFLREQEVAWARYQQFVEEQKDSWTQYRAWRLEEKERGIELDARIAKLVSAIGALLPQRM